MLTTTLLTVLTAAAPLLGGPEGCTPGYWKTHPERWDGIGGDELTISVKHQANFNAFFGVTAAQSGHADVVTLLEAADTGGGGVLALGRHAAAGAASADSGIDYAFSLVEVIDIYRDGVGADAGPLDVDGAKSLLEGANEAGCPHNNDDPPITPYCFGDEDLCPCDDLLSGQGGCPNVSGGACTTPSPAPSSRGSGRPPPSSSTSRSPPCIAS